MFIPTFKNDNTWSAIDDHVGNKKKITVYTKFNLDVIKSLWKIAEKRKNVNPKYQTLFYFDDCGTEKGFKTNSNFGLLNQMAARANHDNCSIIICVQKYTMAAANMRINIDCFLTFTVTDETERKYIYNDYGLPIPFKNFKIKLREYTMEKYSHYYVNRHGAGEPDYYHNFSLINVDNVIAECVNVRRERVTK